MVSYVASFAGVKVPPEGVCGLVNFLAGEGILELFDVAFLENVEATRLQELIGCRCGDFPGTLQNGLCVTHLVNVPPMMSSGRVRSPAAAPCKGYGGDEKGYQAGSKVRRNSLP